MPNPEKTQQLRRLYVAAQNLTRDIESLAVSKIVKEDNVNEAISMIDDMLALLPFPFPKGKLIINPQNPEEEPTKMTEKTVALYEATAIPYLEHMKFRILNITHYYTQDTALRERLKPREIAQASRCVDLIPPQLENLKAWQKEMVVLSAGQLAYYTEQETPDLARLERPFHFLKMVYHIADWKTFGFIKGNLASYYLKFGQQEEAFKIIEEGLVLCPDKSVFKEYETNEAYHAWAAGRPPFQAPPPPPPPVEAPIIIPPFIYPDHPLVKQHADMLNRIRELMGKHYQQAVKSWLKKDLEIDDDFNERYVTRKWTLEELEAFEARTGIRLPGEYKVYLMEIGTDNRRYFMMSDVPGIDTIKEEQIEAIKKPFPITAGKLHDVGHPLAEKGWVYPYLTELAGRFNGDMETLFGLPEGTAFTDGCLFLGYSQGQNELHLIMNGEFEGEVWSDTLQYSTEANGCFGPASIKKLKLLEFAAESMLARTVGIFYASEDGDWL